MKYLLQFFTLTLAITSCTLRPVEVTQINDLRFVQVSDKGVELEVDVTVDNPNNGKIKIRHSVLNGKLDGKNLGTLTLSDGFVLAKNQSSNVTMKVIAKPDNFTVFLPYLFDAEPSKLALDGFVKVRYKGIPAKVKFDIDDAF